MAARTTYVLSRKDAPSIPYSWGAAQSTPRHPLFSKLVTMDKFRIDSHKLMLHVGRVNDWLKGQLVYPIYMEIAPAGGCNHRCIYCALDFLKYRRQFLDTGIFKKRLTEMGKLGVKSIMYAGEGEPLLHKDIGAIIRHTKKSGIDVALTTNAVFLNKKLVDEALQHISWIKISINAGTKKTYTLIHRTRGCDFDTVFENVAYALRVRKKNNFSCALGMQLLLLPENSCEVELLAKKAKAIGVDYLVVKPYSQHPLSITRRYEGIRYKRYQDLTEKLQRLNDKSFEVIVRLHSMQKWDSRTRNYQHCLGLPFWAYIDSCGDLWACSIYLTKEKFRLGNILKESFRRIWESKKHRQLLRWTATRLDTANCRLNCRMDEVNRYLWELKNPPEHANFI